jgi:homoserine O-acetyltransferase/O-succinyltransferase
MPVRTFLFVAMTLCRRAALAEERVNASNDSLNVLEGDYTITGFRFMDGEKLPELRMHYRTIGKPAVVSGEIQNAILLLHGTSSTGAAFLADGFRSAMFGPGQPLDASKYYLILPDSIGLGGSSKPSDRLRARFPHYGYNDMVEAQKQLVTRRLKVQHLKAVFGTSMSGMHCWLWAEKYPTLMDGIIPIACQPERISGVICSGAG